MSQPHRAVTASELVETPSTKGHGAQRRIWRLTLDCGHVVERAVHYDRSKPGVTGKPRPTADVVPAQPKAHCEKCPPIPQVPDLCTHVQITASLQTGRRLIDLMKTAGTVDQVAERPRVGGLVMFKVRFTLNPEGEPSSQPDPAADTLAAVKTRLTEAKYAWHQGDPYVLQADVVEAVNATAAELLGDLWQAKLKTAHDRKNGRIG